MSAIVAPIARNGNGWARTERSRPVSGSRSCIGRRSLRSSKRLNAEPSSPIRGKLQTAVAPPRGGATGRSPNSPLSAAHRGRAVADAGQPVELLRQVPVVLAEELHRGGQEHAADERGVQQDRRREAEA